MINTMETTRVMDICKHNDFCGGCKYQELSYSEQLKLKQEEVKELLKVDRVNPEVFADIEGCPIESQYRYRNKMEYTFGDMVKDGPLCLGMHKIKNFMSIVTVDNCQLVSEDFNKILLFTLNFCTEKGYTKYHKRSHKGLLRNLIVRRGFRTGEIIVNIVTSTESEFAEKEWVEGLLGLCLNDDIVGIMHTLNDNLADAVNCDELRLLHGKDYYMEEILELKFKVHEFAFFQTNVEACERLYSQAIDLIDNLEGKNVFDLYCGTGTISQIMAKRAAKVTGVEIVQESVESAIENARLNNLDNCNFICGDVFEVLESITEKPDVIVVDPPRVGMSPDVVEKLCSYGVEQLVYISCNPKTLTKNLYHFQLLGYEVKYLKPFDNFPMTKHVETCVLLSHKSADDFISVKMEYADDRKIQPDRITYRLIQEYIEEKYGFKVHTANIAEVKRNLGLPMYDAPNAVEELKRPYKPAPEYKVEAIKDALRHFKVID